MYLLRNWNFEAKTGVEFIKCATATFRIMKQAIRRVSKTQTIIPTMTLFSEEQ